MNPSRTHRFVRRSIVSMSALVLIVLMLAGVAGVNAAPSAQPADKFRSSESEGVNTAARRNWTLAELRAARPIDFRARPNADAAANVVPGPDGPAGSVEGLRPAADSAQDGGASLLSSEVPNYSAYPYSTVGKVFFNSGGGSYVCSASIVKPTVIWTAGHCVHAGNNSSSGWSTNVVFVPQYRDGSAPLGQCSVSNLVTTSDWYTYGNPNGLDHDYAVGRISCNVSGQTGTLGFRYNQSYSQTYTAVGYPAGAPFSGGRMINCVGGLRRYGFGTPTTFSIVCDMTGGSSGGPYIVSGGYLNGNVSYGDSTYPGELFSPYFNNDAKALYDYLS